MYIFAGLKHYFSVVSNLRLCRSNSCARAHPRGKIYIYIRIHVSDVKMHFSYLTKLLHKPCFYRANVYCSTNRLRKKQ